LQLLDAKLPFDEAQLLRDNVEYLLRALNLDAVEVHLAEGEYAAKALPGSPIARMS
jgi:hypothetical protein